ncbi:Calcineurin subunit B [Tritrichomonas foetus]|uniref:Calcineurin subunit B n=1 Tax=Tritrichomonas foetus TaxID=1144522 RepID=A0A1J4KUA0_9EUKA|nr:Calcineurin subunit B [Tritrichomonas foetus]|eukprot:OHT13238.1 Calcineurin subunit B [Tritrichomonas foetus]
MGQTQSGNIEILNNLLVSSALTQEDMNRIQKKFNHYDLDGNGSIDINEFRSFKGLDENLLIDRIFHALDQNNDGFIDFYEFCTGLSIFAGPSTKEKKTAFLMKIFDFDDDGFIGQTDLISTIELLISDKLTNEQMEDIARAEIARNDADGDDKLSYEEFSQVIDKLNLSSQMQVVIK